MLKEVWDTPGRTMLRWVQQRLQDEWQSRDWLGLIYHKLVQGAADIALVAAAEKKDQHALRSLLQRDAWLASDTARANARHELRIMRMEAAKGRATKPTTSIASKGDMAAPIACAMGPALSLASKGDLAALIACIACSGPGPAPTTAPQLGVAAIAGFRPV